MKPKRRAYLVDFDDTIIDTKRHKEETKKLVGPKYDDLYNLSKDASDLFDLNKFITLLEKNGVKNPKKLYFSTPYHKYLFPNSLAILKKLLALGKVFIYSKGPKELQTYKIASSGVEKLVGRENTVISKTKPKDLKRIIPDLKAQGYQQITIIDDKEEVLNEAKKIDPNIITTTNLAFAQLSITNRLSNKQMHELVEYSKNDKDVARFTHDPERFESISSTREWLSSGKHIFVLTNKARDLLGLIWFGKKSNPAAPGYPYAFAIRIYGNARGKGFAFDFMKNSFSMFGKKKIWLDVYKDNLVAQNLYLKFGFRRRKKHVDPNRIVMTINFS